MIAALDAVVRSSLILAVGLSAMLAMRRQPAAVRHWTLAATLMLAVVQPAMTLALPEWRLSILTPSPTTVAMAKSGSVETTMAFAAADGEAIRSSMQAPWMRAAAALWLAGVAGCFLLLAAGVLWLTRCGRRATHAGARWQAIGRDVARDLGVPRPVRIAISDRPSLLVTWGSRRPVILLPSDADAWDDDRIRIVLAHEMAHLARHDWLTQVLAESARALHWFNPLFWMACARLRRESEQACDDRVIAYGIAGATYASHLVALARSFSLHGPAWLPAPSIARPSTLERRVRAMLNPHTDRRPVSLVRSAGLAALLVGIAIPIAAATQSGSTATGHVVDPQGLPLPEATIRLASLASDSVHETKTDATGTFSIPDVPVGDYLLSARLPGFSSMRQRVHLSGSVRLDMQLQVGTLQETITVTGPTPGTPDSPMRTSGSTTQTFPPPTCGSTNVGGNIKPPRKVKDVRPRFKQAWADANQEATVLLQAMIGTDGKVKTVEVVSPVQADMEEEAIAAVTQWEFTPTYLNCQAIDVRMFVTVSFRLDR